MNYTDFPFLAHALASLLFLIYFMFYACTSSSLLDIVNNLTVYLFFPYQTISLKAL